MRTNAIAAGFALAACLVSVSCGTFSRQRMELDFSESRYPLSATQYMADPSGTVKGPSAYSAVGPIEIRKDFSVPIREGSDNVLAVNVGSAMDEKIASSGGNAAVNVGFTLVETENPSEFAMNMRVLGTGWIIGGGSLAAMMTVLAVTTGDSDYGDSGPFIGGALVGACLAGAGVGVRFYADDMIENGSIVYTLTVNGTAVRK